MLSVSLIRCSASMQGMQLFCRAVLRSEMSAIGKQSVSCDDAEVCVTILLSDHFLQKSHCFEHETISKLVKIRGKIGKMAVLEEINWDLQEFRALILQNDYKTDKLHTKK